MEAQGDGDTSDAQRGDDRVGVDTEDAVEDDARSTTQMVVRAMLMMMDELGSGLLSWLSRWRSAREATRETRLVASTSSTVQKAFWTRWSWMMCTAWVMMSFMLLLRVVDTAHDTRLRAVRARIS